MSKWETIKTRWSHWEFWPFWFFYFPIFFYYGWLALRERSFFFFTASNPSIEFGGMMGEKKSEIFALLPSKYFPDTFLIEGNDKGKLIDSAGKVGYPLIVKPDIGERGIKVELIENEKDLIRYSNSMTEDFLVQRFVDYPIEFGIFYLRHPDEESGKVTSIVLKDFMKVVGDGKHSVIDLLSKNDRANLQVDVSDRRFTDILNLVPKSGEEFIIEPIGNHCRGTKFLNANEFIDEELHGAIDKLAKSIPEFYFGRFDIRCKSLDDLKNLNHFKILELNGAGAEPGHIYQPGYSLAKAYKEVRWHLNQLALISRANKRRGHQYWSFPKGVKKLLDIRAYNRRLSSR